MTRAAAKGTRAPGAAVPAPARARRERPDDHIAPASLRKKKRYAVAPLLGTARPGRAVRRRGGPPPVP